MNKSEDVSKLFSMFGEKNTDQYQEIYEAEQNQASRERWPVFQRVHVDTDRPQVAPASTPMPPPPIEKAPIISVREETVQAPSPQPVQQTEPVLAPPAPVSPKPMLHFPDSPAPAPTHEASPVPTPAPSSQKQSEPVMSGKLNSLFKRLEGQPEEVQAAPPEEAVTPTPEPIQGSIRSLFSRLSR